MHGLGNDFMVIDAVRQDFKLNSKAIASLADRRWGVGFDQLLLLQKPNSTDHDFIYRVFNADGSEVSQCGNGARCLALFIREEGLSDKSWITLKTSNGSLRVHLDSVTTATIELAAPVWEPAKIPFVADCESTIYELDVDGQILEAGVVSVGNPHLICQVPDLASSPFDLLGKSLSHHARFPDGANVSFVQVINTSTLLMRVYERGVGPTEACGSAAFAATAVARLWGCVDENVLVQQPGGELSVTCSESQHLYRVSGAVAKVFTARISSSIAL
jgi:diaminopimelate epimerase